MQGFHALFAVTSLFAVGRCDEAACGQDADDAPSLLQVSEGARLGAGDLSADGARTESAGMAQAREILRKECRQIGSQRDCEVTSKLLNLLIHRAHGPRKAGDDERAEVAEEPEAEEPDARAPGGNKLATWLFGLRNDGTSAEFDEARLGTAGRITREDARRAFLQLRVDQEVSDAMFDVMDADSDSVVSSEDIATVIRSANLVRGLVPELDRHRGSKSIKERGPGVKQKLTSARSKLQLKCDKQSTEIECQTSRDLVDALIHLTAERHMPRVFRRMNSSSSSQLDLEETLTERTASLAVNLDFWLYREKPFDAMDVNHNNEINMSEAKAGFKRVGDWEVSKEIFPVMDRDSNGVISRYEMTSFLRAAVFVRDLVPEIDPVNPQDTLQHSLYKAHLAVLREEQAKALTGGLKLAFLVVTPFIFWFLMRILCYGTQAFASGK